jgi:potassium efflux system protein
MTSRPPVSEGVRGGPAAPIRRPLGFRQAAWFVLVFWVLVGGLILTGMARAGAGPAESASPLAVGGESEDLGAPAPARESAGEIIDLRAIRSELADQGEMLAEMQADLAPLEQDVARLRERLAAEELSLAGEQIDAAALRRARAELDSSRSRVSVVGGRIEQYRLAERHLRDRIARIEDQRRLVSDTAEELRLEMAHQLLGRQVELTLRLAAAFADLQVNLAERERLLEQRLRLLQHRVQIGAIDDAAAFVADERVPMLESVIADLLRRVTRLRAQLAATGGATAADRQQREVLALQADEAVARAFLRQNDLELVLAQNRLDGLAALREDPLIPVRLLQEALIKLDEVNDIADKVAAELTATVKALEAQRALFRTTGARDDPRLELIDSLEVLGRFQQRDLTALHARLQTERQAYARLIGERSARSLLERQSLPLSGADWRRVAATAWQLPHLTAAAVRDLSEVTAGRARAASAGQWVAAALGSLLLVLALRPARRALRADPGDSLALTRAALARVLPALLPAAVWLVAGLALAMPPAMRLPVVLVLLLWPLQMFVLDLSRRAVAARIEADPGNAEALRRFLHRLRLGVIPAVLVTALYLLSRALPVAPILADLLDRLAMLGLLSLALPAFAARPLLVGVLGAVTPKARRRAAVVARVAQALPVYLVVTALVGLAGYTSLAWAMLDYFGWAAAVGLGLLVVLGILSDLKGRLDAGIATRNGPRESLWRTHFLAPGYRAAQLIAGVAAVWMLLKLWGWNAESPAIRWIGGLLRTELVRIGAVSLSPADLVTVLLMVAAALWIAGWSQQVSYHLAYGRVRDLGLRRALATLTQYVVVVVGLLLALEAIGFDLTTLTIFAGALGVGIGFGLQNIVNNFVSGLLLLGERPLRVGDYVSIGTDEGRVTQIGIRSLTVRTSSRCEVIIPNSAVISGKFTNWTRSDAVLRQLHRIGIGFGDDVELAMRIIAQVLADEPLVLKQPAPAVYLADYGEWAIQIDITYYIDISGGDELGRGPRSSILLEIGRRFAAQGITMPFRRADLMVTLDQQSREALAGGGKAAASIPPG